MLEKDRGERSPQGWENILTDRFLMIFRRNALLIRQLGQIRGDEK